MLTETNLLEPGCEFPFIRRLPLWEMNTGLYSSAQCGVTKWMGHPGLVSSYALCMKPWRVADHPSPIPFTCAYFCLALPNSWAAVMRAVVMRIMIVEMAAIVGSI